ncbi:hypothetical protein A2U01_0069724, partial [Trifolium medium]|nr:hypothetical protein [Trifolium medium]
VCCILFGFLNGGSWCGHDAVDYAE